MGISLLTHFEKTPEGLSTRHIYPPPDDHTTLDTVCPLPLPATQLKQSGTPSYVFESAPEASG